jgi:Fe-S-cluster containining protein
MAVDLKQLRILADAKSDENWDFREFLKCHCDLEPEELDKLVFETTERVWSGIDCTTCANCCREVNPTFSDADIERVAVRLGMDRQALIDKYLKPTDPLEENGWETRVLPCPFLEEDRCSIYEHRPDNCRQYPYLYKDEFVSRLMCMIERIPT